MPKKEEIVMPKSIAAAIASLIAAAGDHAIASDHEGFDPSKRIAASQAEDRARHNLERAIYRALK